MRCAVGAVCRSVMQVPPLLGAAARSQDATWPVIGTGAGAKLGQRAVPTLAALQEPASQSKPSSLPADLRAGSRPGGLRGYTVFYGGSFNPPHNGHLRACKQLLEYHGASRVLMAPAFVHADGKELVDFATRVDMCRMLVQHDPRIAVVDVERQVAGLPNFRPGQTYDTLKFLRREQPQVPLAFAMGADLVPASPAWDDWRKLSAEFRVTVLGRPAYPSYGQPTPGTPISSTLVRERLARGLAVDDLMPAQLGEFISQRSLYRPAVT